jgi:hypothetical protein
MTIEITKREKQSTFDKQINSKLKHHDNIK